MKKINCWEFKECGREAGGRYAEDKGVCPASTEDRLDGTNGGDNAGRACWVVAGTMCKGEPHGTFAMKEKDCSECSFYHLVKDEEGDEVFLTFDLLFKIEGFINHVLNGKR